LSLSLKPKIESCHEDMIERILFLVVRKGPS
jgi:hypothetical protein